MLGKILPNSECYAPVKTWVRRTSPLRISKPIWGLLHCYNKPVSYGVRWSRSRSKCSLNIPGGPGRWVGGGNTPRPPWSIAEKLQLPLGECQKLGLAGLGQAKEMWHTGWSMEGPRAKDLEARAWWCGQRQQANSQTGRCSQGCPAKFHWDRPGLGSVVERIKLLGEGPQLWDMDCVLSWGMIQTDESHSEICGKTLPGTGMKLLPGQTR